MKNITDLRENLFDAIDRLSEATTMEDIELEITKAASIVQVAETLIKSADVENRFLSITKSAGSGFIDNVESEPKEKKTGKLFDVDEKKNWLANDGVGQHSNNKPVRSIEKIK